MKFLAAILSLISLPLLAQTDTEFINKTLYPATALLYSQDESGGLSMLCTATAIEHKGDTYTFLTASHCTSTDNEEDKVSVPSEGFFFISPDNPGHKDFFKAEVIASGYQHRGDDFSMLSVKTDYAFPIVPIGIDSTTFGDAIVNIASPTGLGRQLLFGNISNPKLDRPLVDKDAEINWINAITLQLPNTAGGSSGSSVICISQHAICGILVGTVGKSATIAIPISKFKKFRDQVENGTYKFYKNEKNDAK